MKKPANYRPEPGTSWFHYLYHSTTGKAPTCFCSPVERPDGISEDHLARLPDLLGLMDGTGSHLPSLALCRLSPPPGTPPERGILAILCAIRSNSATQGNTPHGKAIFHALLGNAQLISTEDLALTTSLLSSGCGCLDTPEKPVRNIWRQFFEQDAPTWPNIPKKRLYRYLDRFSEIPPLPLADTPRKPRTPFPPPRSSPLEIPIPPGTPSHVVIWHMSSMAASLLEPGPAWNVVTTDFQDHANQSGRTIRLLADASPHGTRPMRLDPDFAQLNPDTIVRNILAASTGTEDLDPQPSRHSDSPSTTDESTEKNDALEEPEGVDEDDTAPLAPHQGGSRLNPPFPPPEQNAQEPGPSELRPGAATVDAAVPPHRDHHEPAITVSRSALSPEPPTHETPAKSPEGPALVVPSPSIQTPPPTSKLSESPAPAAHSPAPPSPSAGTGGQTSSAATHGAGKPRAIWPWLAGAVVLAGAAYFFIPGLTGTQRGPSQASEGNQPPSSTTVSARNTADQAPTNRRQNDHPRGAQPAPDQVHPRTDVRLQPQTSHEITPSAPSTTPTTPAPKTDQQKPPEPASAPPSQPSPSANSSPEKPATTEQADEPPQKTEIEPANQADQSPQASADAAAPAGAEAGSDTVSESPEQALDEPADQQPTEEAANLPAQPDAVPAAIPASISLDVIDGNASVWVQCPPSSQRHVLATSRPTEIPPGSCQLFVLFDNRAEPQSYDPRTLLPGQEFTVRCSASMFNCTW